MKLMKKTLSIFVCLTSALVALPKGETITHGSATLSRDVNQLDITTSKQAIIHWDQFSIDKNECVQFFQPGKESAVLNRVTGKDLSAIYGMLKSNGSVFLMNKNGILIGESGRIETQNFLASTLDLSDAAFLGGEDLLFSGTEKASVINLGSIQSWEGTVTLLGYTVKNSGTIDASKTLIGAGTSLLLKSNAHGIYIQPAIDNEEGVSITNEGTIRSLETHLAADGNLYSLAIKDDGIIDASSFSVKEGRVWITSGEGRAEISGTITAPEGKVVVLGKEIGLIEKGSIDVSGKSGGGEILFGGDYKGQNASIPNSSAVFVAKDATFYADALDKGDGGKIIVWGDDANRCYGTLFARGGTSGGDGGFVEISSPGIFDPKGCVNVTAPLGKTGTLLLDPTNLQITTNADSANITPGAVYTIGPPPPSPADINNTGLVTQLGLANVIISTASTGGDAGNLQVLAPVSWATGNSLTLVANNNLDVRNQLQCTGTGSIDLQAPNGTLTVGGPLATIPSSVQTTSGTIDLTATIVNVEGSTASNTFVNSTTGNITVTSTAGDVLVLGSSTTSGYAQIGARTSGNVVVTSAGNVNVIGGQDDGSFAQIGYHNGPTTGNISVAAQGNVTVQGAQSNADIAFAQIGPGSVPTAAGNYGGNVTVTANGNTVRIQGGQGNNSHAAIGFGMGTAGTVNIGTPRSTVTLTAPNAALTLEGSITTAQQSHAAIGFFSNSGGMQTNDIINGDVIVECDTFFLDNSNSGTDCYVAIGFATQIGGNTGNVFTIDSDRFTVTANGGPNQIGTIAATSNGAYASIGLLIDSNNISGVALLDNLTVNASGDLLMRGSNQIPSTALVPVVIGVHGGATGNPFSDLLNLNVTSGGLLSMQAGTSYGASAQSPVQIFNGGAATGNTVQTTITAQNLETLSTQAGIGPLGAEADIDSRGFLTINVTQDMTIFGQTGTAINSAINDLTVTVGNNLSISGDATAPFGIGALSNVDGNYTVNVGNDITLGSLAFMTHRFDQNGQNFRVVARNNIISTGALPFAPNITSGSNIAGLTSEMEIFAGHSMLFSNPIAIRKTQLGNLNLIVDDNFPTFPLIGPGGFIFGIDSTIVSDVPVRIFTARRSLNTVLGTIRGFTFSPGPAFVNSDTEFWCAYYFNPFVGPEYTIFYKECDEIIAEIFRQSSAPIVTVEALRNLHPYDEYLGWPIHFDFFFEKMERASIPYFLRVPKRGEHSPKQKEVETFDLTEQDIL